MLTNEKAPMETTQTKDLVYVENKSADLLISSHVIAAVGQS